MRLLRTIPTTVGLLLAALVAAALPATATAHQNVVATTPARGGTALTTTKAVTVTFDGTHIRSGTLKVTGPRGRVVSIGTGGRDPRNVKRLSVKLATGLAAGGYTASWTIVAADGHNLRGSFTFRLRAPS